MLVSRSRQLALYRRALIGTDLTALMSAFILAGVARASLEVLPFQPDIDPLWYLMVALAVVPGFLALFAIRGAYDPEILLGGPDEYTRVIGTCFIGTIAVAGVSYLYGTAPIVSRGWLVFFWILSSLGVCLGRFSLRRLAYQLRRRGWFRRRALIVGASAQGSALVRQINHLAGHGIEVVGLLDDHLPVGMAIIENDVRVQILGHPREVDDVPVRYHCDLIVAVPSALSWESQSHLARVSALGTVPAEIRLIPALDDFSVLSLRPAPIGYLPLLRLEPARLTFWQRFQQRSVDICLSILGLLFGLPVVVLLIAMSWLRGIRLPFRSYHVRGRHGQPVHVTTLSQSVTASLLVRGILALLAVLKGDLALVGPRPVRIHEHPHRRLSDAVSLGVAPGLTGFWRLASPETPTSEQILMDFWWLRQWSLSRYLLVIAHTLFGSFLPTSPSYSVRRWDPGATPMHAPSRIFGDTAPSPKSTTAP